MILEDDNNRNHLIDPTWWRDSQGRWRDSQGLRIGSPQQSGTNSSFGDWWKAQTAEDIERTTPKIEEYGTRDLTAMGMAFLESRGQLPGPNHFHAMTGIYGCMFYALGKTMRAIAALERGEMPSEDTLFDLSVYAMMARSYQNRGEL